MQNLGRISAAAWQLPDPPSGPPAVLTGAMIAEALGQVIDPCSRFNGTCLSLSDLGMIEDVQLSDRTVRIRLLLDDPTCLYTYIIQKELRDTLGAFPQVSSVDIELVANEVWTEDRMKPAARALLLRSREERRARLKEIAALRNLRMAGREEA
jgi:metal-sulfur cluster biosynthetic enzyme